MTRIRSYFILLAVVLVWGACGSTQYYMEFMVPSNRYIPPKVWRAVAINRAAPEGKYSRIPTLQNVVRDVRDLNIKTGGYALNELIKVDTVLNRYKWAEGHPVYKSRGGNRFLADTLSADEMKKYCTNYNADALVTIDGMDNLVKLKSKVDFSYGYPKSVKWFVVNQRIDWRFYDCEKRFVGDHYTQSNTKVVYEDELGSLPVKGNMPAAEKAALYAAQVAAGRYYERIAPHWRGEYRKLYIGGSDRLEAAAFQLRENDDVDKAISLWKNSIRNGSKKVKRRAYFNLALASEIKGHPEVGLEWLNQGIDDVGAHNTLTEYQSALKEQVKELELVERQLGY